MYCFSLFLLRLINSIETKIHRTPTPPITLRNTTAPINTETPQNSYPNNKRNASSTLATECVAILKRPFSPCALFFGIMILLNPNFSASAMRCSIRLTGRTSPLNPTSPAIHHPASIGVSTFDDNTAAITLKSVSYTHLTLPTQAPGSLQGKGAPLR